MSETEDNLEHNAKCYWTDENESNDEEELNVQRDAELDVTFLSKVLYIPVLIFGAISL